MKSETNNLSHVYNQNINNNIIDRDENQLKVIKLLEQIKTRLENLNKEGLRDKLLSDIKKLLAKVSGKVLQDNIKGLYLYSGVGRGKTMLMDLFFHNLNLPDEQKFRTHFHLFMRSMHEKLQQSLGIEEPIEYIISTQYSHYKVICLDEFMVHDIADAMVLSKILEYLIKYNIVLITTSNVKPDDLYFRGLQRQSFLPAIDLINKQLNVVNLAGDTDYRAKMLIETSCYFSPVNKNNIEKLESIFNKISNKVVDQAFNINCASSSVLNSLSSQSLTHSLSRNLTPSSSRGLTTSSSRGLTAGSRSSINHNLDPAVEPRDDDEGYIKNNILIANREIKVIKSFDYTVWFDFNIICNSPRSNTDYLEIAEVYKVVIISGLYQLDDHKNDIAKRFINLIDILYDYKVKLIICADVELTQIYIGTILKFEFARTISRLKEMQTELYLGQVHL